MVHGEFGKWSESIGIHASDASRFIKVYDEVGGSELGTYTNLGMTRRYANMFVKVADELGGSNVATLQQTGLIALYLIATMSEEAHEQFGRPNILHVGNRFPMPEESRTESHTIPSTGVTKTVDEMTVRELREVDYDIVGGFFMS